MTQNHGITSPFLGNMDRNPANLFASHSAWHPAAIDPDGHRNEMSAVWMSNTAHPHVRDQNMLTDKDPFRAAPYPYNNYYKTTHGSHNALGVHNISNTHDTHGAHAMHLALSTPMVHGMPGENGPPIPPVAHGVLGVHGSSNSLTAQQGIASLRVENGINTVAMENMRRTLNLPGHDVSLQMPSSDRSILLKRQSKGLQQCNSAGKTSKKPRMGHASNTSQTASCSVAGGRTSGDGSARPNQKKGSQTGPGPNWKHFISNLKTNPYEMSDSFRHHMDPEAPVLSEDCGKSDDEPTLESTSAAEKNSKEARKTRVMEAKEALNRGQEHVNSKGKLIRARKMGDGCAGKGCRFKCEARISLEARTNIFNYFWNLGNHQLQWLFIAMHTSVRAPKQRTQDPIRSRRKTSRSYFFRQGTSKIPVCKTMFLQTLDVSDSWVDTAISKAANGIAVAPDCRGRHTKVTHQPDTEGESVKKKKRQKKKRNGDATDLGVAAHSQLTDVELAMQNAGNIHDEDTNKSISHSPLDLHEMHLNRVSAVHDTRKNSSTSQCASLGNDSNTTCAPESNTPPALGTTHTAALDAGDSHSQPALPALPALASSWGPASVGSSCPASEPGEADTEQTVEAEGDAAAEPPSPLPPPLPPLPPPSLLQFSPLAKAKKRKRADVSAALGAAASGLGVGVGGMLAAASVPEQFRHLLDPMTLGLRELPNGAVVTAFSNDEDGLTVAPPPPHPPPVELAVRKQKRQREPARWRATQCKVALNMGKEHVNLKGKLVRARHLGEGCVETCRFRCRDRIDDADRESIFTHFWGLGDHRLQWLFISRHTRVREPKHRTTNVDPELSRRKTSRSYFFTVFRPASAVARKRHGHLPDQPVEVEVPVCKTMFLRTLDVSDSWVESAIAKVHMAQGEDTYELTDRRGRHRKATRRIPEPLVESVKQHTSMFPRSGVPPGAKGFQRKCLADGHSVTKMYSMYLDWMEQRQLQLQQGDQAQVVQQVQVDQGQPPKKRPARTVATLRQYRDILARQLRAEFNVQEEEDQEEDGDGDRDSEKEREMERAYAAEMGSEMRAEVSDVTELSFDHEDGGEEEGYDGEVDEGEGEEYLPLHPKCEMIQGETDADVEW